MSVNEIEVTLYNEEEGSYQATLPAAWAICSTCEGEGRHLHPAIRYESFTPEQFNEEFAEDEEQEAYFAGGRGMYGVQCQECKGTGKVMEIDRDACDEETLAQVDARAALDADFDRMREAERRMGA